MGMDLIKFKMNQDGELLKVKGESKHFPNTTVIDYDLIEEAYSRVDNSFPVLCLNDNIVKKTQEVLDLEKELAENETKGYSLDEEYTLHLEIINRYEAAVNRMEEFGEVVESVDKYRVSAVELRLGDEIGYMRKPFRLEDSPVVSSKEGVSITISNFSGQKDFETLKSLLMQGYGEWGDLYFTFEHVEVLKEISKYVDKNERAYFRKVCKIKQDEFININW